MLNSIVRDAIGGVRLLRRRPGFAFVACATLALGVGINVAVFSAVRTALLDDLPYGSAPRLTTIHEIIPRAVPQSFPISDFDALRTRQSAFDPVAGCTATAPVTVHGSGAATRAFISRVTPSFFSLFGSSPLMGRALDATDASAGPHVAVIASALWRSQFGGDPNVIGQQLFITGQPFTVVGVMADAFSPPCLGSPLATMAWVPLDAGPIDGGISPASSRVYLTTFGRLAPNANLELAHQQVDAVMAQLKSERRGAEQARVERLGAVEVAALRPGLLLLQGVSAFLLLISCANLANLFLAHSTARRAEFGIRAALGADRMRIAGQVLAEAGVVALIGSALGVVFAYAALPGFVALAMPVMPRAHEIVIGVPELLVGLSLGCATVLLAAVAPALVVSRGDALDAIRAGASRVTSMPAARAWRNILVATEVASAIVVIIGAGILIRSFVHVMALPMGFNPRGLITAEIQFPLPTAPAVPTQVARASIRRLEDELRLRLSGAPFTIANEFPYNSSMASVEWSIVSSDGVPSAKRSYASIRVVQPNYFDVLGMPLRRGRLFGDADRDGAELVALVNDTFVSRYANGRDLIGAQMLDYSNRSVTIVGVVGDTRGFALASPPDPAVYLPLDQRPAIGLSIAIRGMTIPVATSAVEAAVRAVNPEVPITHVDTIDAKVSEREAKRHFYLSMLSFFGALGGVLSAVGIYGVTAHATGLRTRELGIRLALGARPAQLRRLVVSQGLVPVACGLAAGVVCAWWLIGLLKTNAVIAAQLYNVAPRDPWSLALAPLGFLAVAAIACWIPARLTTRVEPASVLRAD